MKTCMFNKTIPVEPRSMVSPTFGLPKKGYRGLIQSYFPSLPPCVGKESRFAIRLLFRMNGRKSKAHPRSDLDNLIKPILDAGRGYFWHDDCQVDEIIAKIKRHDNKSNISIAIFQLENKKATERPVA